MSKNSRIEWCDHTWNIVTGCEKVSAGCAHCYAEGIARRFWKDRKFSDVQVHPERLRDPLHWRKPSRIFVNSMSDLFHNEVNYDFIGDVVDTIFDCPQHTFMILTKRPERMQFIFSECFKYLSENPLPNLWLGVSVEDQKSAYERIPLLLDTPAAVRFVSCEPLLGPVYLDEIPQVLLSVTSTNRKDSYLVGKGRLDWVIAGGESGPKARPMHPDWVRGLRDQCLAGNIPFFFKSWGEWAQTYYNFLVVDKFGKKKASRLLDGVEWNEFPEIAVNE